MPVVQILQWQLQHDKLRQPLAGHGLEKSLQSRQLLRLPTHARANVKRLHLPLLPQQMADQDGAVQPPARENADRAGFGKAGHQMSKLKCSALAAHSARRDAEMS